MVGTADDLFFRIDNRAGSAEKIMAFLCQRNNKAARFDERGSLFAAEVQLRFNAAVFREGKGQCQVSAVPELFRTLFRMEPEEDPVRQSVKPVIERDKAQMFALRIFAPSVVQDPPVRTTVS